MSLPRSPLARRIGVAALVFIIGAASTAVYALHPKSAGPETFEIKFKLPPPSPLTPEQELATFKIQKGFKIELAAAEPLVDSPTAISWDEKGRMFVLEMRPYMHDVEGAGEDQDTGRVVMLEDADGDGRYEKRTVFADGLHLPRAIMCVNGGVLVGAPPMLYFMKDTDGDGKADTKEPVDSHFGSVTGQPEHMVNSPVWFMDNWIYLANHSLRYKLKDGRFIADRAPTHGQWGLSQDNIGRPFYNYNSDFLRTSLVPDVLYGRNPDFPGAAGANLQVIKDQTCWPIHPTPGVNRGYETNALREDGSLEKCTATCGAMIYRGGLFGKDVQGNAFIPEPAGNLVKRLAIDEKDNTLVGRNVYEKVDFLASTDERFRPVNAYTGPDGAIYIVDMYRGVIQHKGFLTHYLVANIKDRKLEEPYDKGRIWRIVPDTGADPKAPKLPTDSAGWVAQLSSPNGWVRDTAQRVLVERKDATVAPALTKLASSGAPLAKLHALWTLEGMGAANAQVLTAALKDRDAHVRAAAVRMADLTLAPELAKLVKDPSMEVRTELAFNVGSYPETQEIALALGRASGKDATVREALVSGMRTRELDVLTALLAGKQDAPEFAGALAQAVMTEHRTAKVTKLLELIASQTAGSPLQNALLTGAAGKAPAKGAPKKYIYLDAEPKVFTALATAADPKTKAAYAAVDTRLAWPNKPGVPPPPVIKPLTPAEQQLFDGGKVTFNTLCAACHQPTGLGMAGLAPTLVDSNWVLGNPDVLPRIVLHGLSGPLKVNGETWSLEMPPLGAALSDEQVAGVLTYIRREWEHGASPISVAKVAEIRAEHKDRTKAWDPEELTDYLAAKKKGNSKSGEKAPAAEKSASADEENLTGDKTTANAGKKSAD